MKDKEEISGYRLTTLWWNFVRENPEKVKAIHSVLCFYLIDYWNRLGRKDKFGLPTESTMDNLGLSNKKTYYSAFKDLVDFGFITIVAEAKNQNTSRIISFCAGVHFVTSEYSSDTPSEYPSDTPSTVPIDKEVKVVKEFKVPTYAEFLEYARLKAFELNMRLDLNKVKLKYDAWSENDWHNQHGRKIKIWKSNLANTLPYLQLSTYQKQALEDNQPRRKPKNIEDL